MGATWWLTEFEPEAVSVDLVRGVLRDDLSGELITDTDSEMRMAMSRQ